MEKGINNMTNPRALATIIWQQLNSEGAMIPMSWGTHGLKALPEKTEEDFKTGGLQLRVQGAKFKGHIRIILNWDDTYIVRFGKLRKCFRLIKEFNNIYNDQLVALIDDYVETK